MNDSIAAGQPVPDKSLTTVVYALQALYFASGFAILAAVAINYWKKDEVRGTWLESHFRWQKDTFWGFVIGFATVVVLMLISLGTLDRGPDGGGRMPFLLAIVAVLVALHVWLAYRVVKGWMRLSENRPI